MSTEQSKTRPIGVWFFTIYVGLFAGAVPSVVALWMFVGFPEARDYLTPFTMAGSVLLGFGVLVSSVMAWRGLRWARYALVAFAALHYLGVAYNNYVIASSGMAPEGKEALMWGRVVRSLLTASIVAWYFLLNQKVQEFYGPSAKHRLDHY